MNPRYAQVALRAGHRCEYCHAPEAVFNLSLEVEHVVPVSREEQWEEHFRVEAESGEIEGRTPVGRATVVRLGMNSAAQVAARRQWTRLGLFP